MVEKEVMAEEKVMMKREVMAEEKVMSEEEVLAEGKVMRKEEALAEDKVMREEEALAEITMVRDTPEIGLRRIINQEERADITNWTVNSMVNTISMELTTSLSIVLTRSFTMSSRNTRNTKIEFTIKVIMVHTTSIKMALTTTRRLLMSLS